MESYAKSLIEKNSNAVFRCVDNRSYIIQDIENCETDCAHLEALLEFCTNGEKFRLMAAIAKLKSFKQMMQGFQIILSGSGTSAAVTENNTATTTKSLVWEDLPTSAFKRRIRGGVITNLHFTEPKAFLEECKTIIIHELKKVLEEYGSIKVNAVFCGEYKKNQGEIEIAELKHMNTRNVEMYRADDINKIIDESLQEPILRKLEEFQEKDSGWALSAIINLVVNINQHNPMVGSSHIKTPTCLLRKKACINIQNNDNACFAWAVVSALYPASHNTNRLASYPHYLNVLNLDGITFPMDLNKIPTFEDNNDISINIFTYDCIEVNKKHEILPLKLSKLCEKGKKHINLLLLQERADDDCNAVINQHFIWIKNMSRLLRSEHTSDHQVFYCDRCLHYFYSKEKLEQHQDDCFNQNNCKIRLPKLNNEILSFKNYKNKLTAPYIIYADLECVLKEKNNSNTYQEHIPSSIGYYLKCSFDDNCSKYESYRGEDCIEWFATELGALQSFLNIDIVPMNNLTNEENRDFQLANECYICEKPFTLLDKKVRDHCHLTGKYRGPAHNKCNLNFQDDYTIPIIFHNLSSYDAHFIIKEIHKAGEGRINVLPLNKEKYISFTKSFNNSKIKFRFIDSFRFLSSSLDSLASLLDKFPILESKFSYLHPNQINLLKRKGVYPYDYMNSFDKFSEESLPDKKFFYNKLNKEDISDNDYLHAQMVWTQFKIKNIGEYSDLYMKVDILLLCEIFEQFRANLMRTYKLDPAHYYTLPGYTWDAMLFHTGISLELLTDIDMIMFIERGIRGGLTQCSKRYSEANNRYLENFDNNKVEKYLMYWDINNQYGYAMTQYLPIDGFQWIDDINTFNENKIRNLENDSLKGYIFEVDLDYPNELHDLHSDIPFCAENMCPPGSKQKKLLATLYDKQKYVIHYRNLKQALQHGLKLSRIHRVLEFNQSPWLKSYINLNTNLRSLATNDFEKNLYKLMNNAVFGKTMENVRKYSNVKLVSKWEGRYGANALIASPFYKNSTIFNENLVAIELFKSEVYFCKPIYVGLSVLEISKTLIYSYQYDYMKPRFGDNCKVLYTDTDSLIYEISNTNIYDTIKNDCEIHFDTSDYSPTNIWNIPQVNKKIVGLMKDELNGNIMSHFVGLRSKMYSIKVMNQEKIKKIKGVKKGVVKKEISFDDFVNCLENSCNKFIQQNLIRSKMHNVESVTQTKLALNSADDKRYILPNNHDTLPWGHYSINNQF